MRQLAFALAAAALLFAPAMGGENEDALIAADTAFNAMAQKDGVAAAFAAYAAPDARMFRGEETPVSGPAEIEALMANQYAAGGTLGFTHGRWTYTSPKGEDGTTKTALGSYVSIWAKQPDGSYKFAVDIGNPDPPKESQD